MTTVECGKFSGKELKFFQCDTIEEAKEKGLTNGVYFYWELDGERIENPYQIIQVVQKGIQDGSYGPAQMLTGQSIHQHYENLFNAQQEMIMSNIANYREAFEQSNAPAQAKQAAMDGLNNMAQFFGKNMPFPGIDGMFRPESRAQAVQMLGSDELVDKMIPKDKRKEWWGE